MYVTGKKHCVTPPRLSPSKSDMPSRFLSWDRVLMSVSAYWNLTSRFGSSLVLSCSHISRILCHGPMFRFVEFGDAPGPKQAEGRERDEIDYHGWHGEKRMGTSERHVGWSVQEVMSADAHTSPDNVG